MMDMVTRIYADASLLSLGMVPPPWLAPVPDEHTLEPYGDFERASQWPALLAQLIAKQPFCGVCGRPQKDVEKAGGILTGHHIQPVHVYPDRELDPDNVFIICESRGLRNCHFGWGHFYNWSAWNPDIKEMAEAFLKGLRWARHLAMRSDHA